MIFGMLVPEKNWNPTGLFTSPIRCSYFTLRNPKKSFATVLFIHTSDYLFCGSRGSSTKLGSNSACSVLVGLDSCVWVLAGKWLKHSVVLQLLKPPRRKNVGPADDLLLLTVTRWHGTDFWYTKFWRHLIRVIVSLSTTLAKYRPLLHGWSLTCIDCAVQFSHQFHMENECHQCFDAVGWVAGSASGTRVVPDKGPLNRVCVCVFHVESDRRMACACVRVSATVATNVW